MATVTKQTFIRAAAMVKAIRDGEWTNDPPTWATVPNRYDAIVSFDIPNYVRAVQTAEAFIILFTVSNDRFNVQRFLVACGLAEPTKGRKHA